MVTDDERRRVARELKHIGSYYQESLDKILRAILRVDDEAWVPDLLADLIEPSCDRDALLALTDELRESLSWVEADDDSQVSVPRRNLVAVVSRIREACGEVENGQTKNAETA